MRIISTNIGTPTTILWNGKEEQTGIFKRPVDKPLILNHHEVAKDTIIDRVHHGGTNKACYLFSSDTYPHWKKLYPQLDWNWGMFGENITVKHFDEASVRIGNIYRIGSALVQVSQPREPCYKLGIRFGDQSVLKKFIAYRRPGTYVRVLEEGEVSKGNEMKLIEQSKNTLTVRQFYDLIFQKEKSKVLLTLFMQNTAVPQYKKDRMQKYL